MIFKNNSAVKVVIAAAGQGSRSGLPYPKTLFEIKNKPIIISICELLSKYDGSPTIIVSPKWQKHIENTLLEYQINGELVCQDEPLGMGDALLCFEKSSFFHETKHVILIWGDVPFIKSSTVEKMVESHISNQNMFTFPTRDAKHAYTLVSRNEIGEVVSVTETRELNVTDPQPGERDIGLFIFQKEPIFSMLKKDLPNKFGRSTNEHSFLYILEYLYKNQLKIEALKIATQKETVSFNSIEDIASYL
jgi:bifunctional UDP-N-acetylglucosamine pyrophosphorylase/glucosamine-1-phosphate N-acetyltransferase